MPSSRRLHLPLGVLVALVVLASSAGRARAQRGVDAQTFRPSLDGFGLLVVERADTGRQWDFGFKLTTDYAQNPLRLALHDAGASPGARQTLMEWQATLHFGAHFSFTDWLEFALEVPVSAQSWSAAYGSPYSDATGGPTGFYAAEMRTSIEPPGAGVLDPRVALKARTRRMGPLALALVAAATVPLGDERAFLGDGGFTLRPAGVIDLALGRLALALNVGAILRRTTTVLDPLPESGMQPAVLVGAGHELTASLGAQVKLASWMAISAEAYALIPLVKILDRDGKDVSNRVLGVLGALRFFPGRDLTLSLGGGAGLLDGPRHDAFRVVLGLSWTPADSGRGGRGGGGGGSGDRDNDGISDGLDLCPEAAEDKDAFEDADGCPDPDNDGDGVPDASDRCPAEPEDRDGFEDADGCPDADNDDDGVLDIALNAGESRDMTDQCPDEAEDKDGFEDDDGCPDPDNDGDGIPDARDRCPDEPETANGADDEDGCPDGSGDEPGFRAGAAAQGGVTELVFFDKNKSKPTAPSYAALDRAAKLLREGDRRARLESFADPTEKRAALGTERARAVQAELQKRGVDAARIDVAAAAHGKHRSGGARRVEIVIVEAGK